jgi:pimeloyl-ACP methyl ester carboxylesterase
MGGGVGTLFACAAPERIRSLVLLDVIGPMSGAAGDTAKRLRHSLAESRKPTRKRKRYESIEQMVQARMANSDIQQEAARLISERSAAAVDGGFEWRNDPALYWASPFYITEEQALECLSSIEAAVYSLIAQPFAPFIRAEQFQQRKQAIRHGQHALIEGGHHFHMEQPETIAAQLHCFIMEQERLSSGQQRS